MIKTFIALICLINFAFCYDKDNLSEAKYMANLTSQLWSKNLPQQLDQITTIKSVSSFENKVIFSILLKEYNESIQSRTKNSTIKFYCTDEKLRQILNYGVEFIFQYSKEDDYKPLFRNIVTARECN